MICGLSDTENEFIFNTLINPLKKLNCKIYLFGSRATKTNKKFSDIDLLYSHFDFNNQQLSQQIERTIFNLLIAIEESKFPYKIDLVKLQDLASSYLLKVDAEKIEI